MCFVLKLHQFTSQIHTTKKRVLAIIILATTDLPHVIAVGVTAPTSHVTTEVTIATAAGDLRQALAVMMVILAIINRVIMRVIS